MVSRGKYPRWLGNEEVWVAEQDWEPDEFLKWNQRLSDAKKQLKTKYAEVDSKAFDHLLGAVRAVKPASSADKLYEEITARFILRYGIAYNFYTRITFEDVPDSKAVDRVQKYLISKHHTGMHPRDIAHMLQAAADKVPFTKAVRDILEKTTKFTAPAVDLLSDWYTSVMAYNDYTANFVEGMTSYSKTGVPTLDELPDIFHKIQMKDDGNKLVADANIERALKIMDTDEKIDQFLTLRRDPGVKSAVLYVQHRVEYCQLLLKDFGNLNQALNKIAEEEKNNLSWAKSIGPACVAIVRLGKRSAGKDFEKLAEYARAHSRPKNR